MLKNQTYFNITHGSDGAEMKTGDVFYIDENGREYHVGYLNDLEAKGALPEGEIACAHLINQTWDSLYSNCDSVISRNDTQS